MVREKVIKLIRLYNQQTAIYREMHTVVKSQYQLCHGADFTKESSLNELNALIFKRQKQIKQIEENKKEIIFIYKYLQQKLALSEISTELLYRYYPSREMFEQQLKNLKKIGMLLKDISAFDVQIQEFFQDNLNLLKQKISRVQTEKKLLKTYHHGQQQKEGIFIDRSK